MTYKLSILICTLKNRKEKFLTPLLKSIPKNDNVEILINEDEGEKTIGTKRNELLKKATGDYIAFVDDDDILEPNYIDNILNAIKSNPDVVGIHLLHYHNGKHTGLTYHSLKYTSWWEEKNHNGLTNYYRNPNHLNPVKRELALMVMFPEINFGEDREYSLKLLPLLKKEVYIDEPIYRYMFRSDK